MLCDVFHSPGARSCRMLFFAASGASASLSFSACCVARRRLRRRMTRNTTPASSTTIAKATATAMPTTVPEPEPLPPLPLPVLPLTSVGSGLEPAPVAEEDPGVVSTGASAVSTGGSAVGSTATACSKTKDPCADGGRCCKCGRHSRQGDMHRDGSSGKDRWWTNTQNLRVPPVTPPLPLQDQHVGPARSRLQPPGLLRHNCPSWAACVPCNFIFSELSFETRFVHACKVTLPFWNQLHLHFIHRRPRGPHSIIIRQPQLRTGAEQAGGRAQLAWPRTTGPAPSGRAGSRGSLDPARGRL
jgi:hypothetical protein